MHISFRLLALYALTVCTAGACAQPAFTSVEYSRSNTTVAPQYQKEQRIVVDSSTIKVILRFYESGKRFEATERIRPADRKTVFKLGSRIRKAAPEKQIAAGSSLWTITLYKGDEPVLEYRSHVLDSRASELVDSLDAIAERYPELKKLLP